jgi:hypothetical protein
MRMDRWRPPDSGPAGLGCSKGQRCSYSDVIYFDIFQTLPGPFPSKVDSIVFALRDPENIRPDDVPSRSDLRLFSSGGGSELIEWDLKQGCVQVNTKL